MGLTLHFTEIWGYPIDFKFYIYCADAAIPLTNNPGGPQVTVVADVYNLETAEVVINCAGIMFTIISGG